MDAPSLHALVVDDDPMMRVLLARLLSHFRLGRIDEAMNGEEALAAMAERAPDLVLCDIQMPGMDGRAVVRTIRSDARLGDVAVVAVTAVCDREVVVELLQLGVRDYILKPLNLAVTHQRLAAVIGEVTRRKRAIA
ncbi:MAG TPA: response regulator [Gemmatimonadales bacterium]|nr:response regulator [Gemmatimonadales bacterium]